MRQSWMVGCALRARRGGQGTAALPFPAITDALRFSSMFFSDHEPFTHQFERPQSGRVKLAHTAIGSPTQRFTAPPLPSRAVRRHGAWFMRPDRPFSWCEKIVKKSFSNAAGYHKTTPVSTRGKHRNNLYYLLPGMGHGARKRFWRNMALGVLMGVLVSALMVWLFSFLNSW